MKKEHPLERRCSFCAKHQREVRKLIAGPTVYICDECIKLCNDILAEQAERIRRESAETASSPKKEEALKGPGQMLCCSFCGKGQREVKVLIAGPTVYICDECIGLCNDIIAEEIAREEPVAGLEAELPGGVRSLLSGILERGMPTAVRIMKVLYQRIVEENARRRAAGDPPDELLYTPWALAADWRGLHAILAKAPPRTSESGEEGPLAAEFVGWASSLTERLTATLQVLDALVRSLEEPGLQAVRQLHPSVDVALEKLQEAREMVLARPHEVPRGPMKKVRE